ncbi:MAG TPA: acyltransferase [Terriglobales bacterium]
MTASKRSPLPALTGIRIFAAYYVVMYHTGAGYFGRHGAPAVILRLLDKGYLAVSLFFILSGFILVYTYQGKISGPENILRFWEARFARIYPVYLLALGFMFPPLAKTLTAAQRLAVLCMVQAWIPGRPDLQGAWNFPAWSLSVEAFFYLAFPLIVLALNRVSTAGLCRLVGLLLAVIAIGNLTRLAGLWYVAVTWVRYVPLPVLRLPEFIVGMALGLTFLRAPAWRYSGLISVVSLLCAITILCLPLGRWASVVVIPFAILMISLAYQRGPVARLLSNRIIILLGSASYAVYLLQFPTRFYTRLIFAHILHSPHNLDAFLSPCLLLILSVLVFLFWEEPARKFLRKSFGLRPRWKWPYLPAEHPLPDEALIKSAEDR